MKANELRIGVLVWLKSKQAYYQIESGHDIEEIVDAEELSDAEPILLTESIISKTEFEYMQDGWYKFDEFTWNIFDKGLRYNGVHLGEPDYLHEIQNIIFAICGEELDVSKLIS